MLLFNLVIKLYSINEKPLKEVLADVPPLSPDSNNYTYTVGAIGLIL